MDDTFAQTKQFAVELVQVKFSVIHNFFPEM